jgi:sulfur carrier protein
MSILKINGSEKSFPEGPPETLSRLLEQLEIDAATVVAEVDGAIVKRDDFGTTALSDGQSIELVRFVGGG